MDYFHVEQLIAKNDGNKGKNDKWNYDVDCDSAALFKQSKEHALV
jgi:hypothetical protein